MYGDISELTSTDYTSIAAVCSVLNWLMSGMFYLSHNVRDGAFYLDDFDDVLVRSFIDCICSL